MRLPSTVLLALSLLATAGCGPRVQMSDLVREYVYTSLTFSPVAATAAGYHSHQDILLDELLDSYDEKDLQKVRAFLREFRAKLDRVRQETLDSQDKADYQILDGNVRQWQLELDTIQNYRRNPTLYVELAGNALFTPMVVEYASPEDRFRHIIARISRLPALLGQARQNLRESPQIWTEVALQENDGNYDLIHVTLREKCPKVLRSAYDRAAVSALRAISDFRDWLKTELSSKTADWRLGKEKYALKFDAMLGLGRTPQQVLAEAETELRTVRQRMFEIALPLHQQMYPGAKDRSDLNSVVSEVLAKIAEKHSTPESYFEDAKRDLAEVRDFVNARKMVALPSGANLQVIPTPEFMRGIYSVGGFNPAPPMQPALGAFYWLTPIPESWPPERIASKLREYNHYGLKLLTVHEAIPGHYLQFEFANQVRPTERRLLRALYGNGPYIEGWAVYATEMTLDEGYLDNDPQLRLTFLKQQLRMIANTILDVRLHTMSMTDQEALDLMIQQCFQEKEEATGKLQRAKLSSVQLPTYYTGWKQWWELRRKVQAARGPSFNLAAFHEQALKAGAVPLPALEAILVAP